MTVILASLAMDRWHGLFLSRRMNTFCTVCCVSSPPLYQQRDIEKKKEKKRKKKKTWDLGQGISIVCRILLGHA